MWVIQDFEETAEELLGEPDAGRFCSVMADTQNCDSLNLGSITSKSSIDELWMSYSEEDQATWVINSGCMNHITERRELLLEETY